MKLLRIDGSEGRISYSAVKTADPTSPDGCIRKAWFRVRMNKRGRGNEATDVGHDFHRLQEVYLSTGEVATHSEGPPKVYDTDGFEAGELDHPVPLSPTAIAMFHAARPALDKLKAELPNLVVEARLDFHTTQGARGLGFVDVSTPPGEDEVPHVIDTKTRSLWSWNNRPSAEELVFDTQLGVYVYLLYRDNPPPAVRIGHFNASRVLPYKTELVYAKKYDQKGDPTLIPWDVFEKTWEEFCASAQPLLDSWYLEEHEVPTGTPSACWSYRKKCEMAGICSQFPIHHPPKSSAIEPSGDAYMSTPLNAKTLALLKKMKSIQTAVAASPTPEPTPEPETTPEPAPEPTPEPAPKARPVVAVATATVISSQQVEVMAQQMKDVAGFDRFTAYTHLVKQNHRLTTSQLEAILDQIYAEPEPTPEVVPEPEDQDDEEDDNTDDGDQVAEPASTAEVEAVMVEIPDEDRPVCAALVTRLHTSPNLTRKQGESIIREVTGLSRVRIDRVQRIAAYLEPYGVAFDAEERIFSLAEGGEVAEVADTDPGVTEDEDEKDPRGEFSESAEDAYYNTPVVTEGPDPSEKVWPEHKAPRDEPITPPIKSVSGLPGKDQPLPSVAKAQVEAVADVSAAAPVHVPVSVVASGAGLPVVAVAESVFTVCIGCRVEGVLMAEIDACFESMFRAIEAEKKVLHYSLLPFDDAKREVTSRFCKAVGYGKVSVEKMIETFGSTHLYIPLDGGVYAGVIDKLRSSGAVMVRRA